MPRTKPQPRRPSADDPAPPAPSPAVWLTRGAFVLAAGLVFARATMLETLRNPLDVNPGAESIPRGPGAGTGLVLDMLCFVPALLVLARRAADGRYALRFSWSFVPMLCLGVWTVASTLWAGDKFAAAVGGTHWLCAGVLLWSVAQLVRDRAGLRLAAAVCVGLLLVQAGQGLYYRYVEHPDLVASWNAQRDEIIRQRGWAPDSFIARQFEKRVLSDEMMGFTSSPNSFGAVLALLTLVTAGVAAQRVADRDGPWAAAPAGVAALALGVILLVNSRTAMATCVLGAALLAAVWMFRPTLARRPRLFYALGVGAVVLVVAAVVGHGLHHGTLFHDSLTFRWRYWVAGARLFGEHPLVGVGWENFGPHYLAVRLPVAAEEIKDPHNFLVRFATELGAVGLALAVAWMLSLWWDLTQTPKVEGRNPSPGAPGGGGGDGSPSDISDSEFETKTLSPSLSRGARRGESELASRSPLGDIAAIGCVGLFVNVLAAVDWAQAGAYNALEVMRRLGFLCLFVLGAAMAALRSAGAPEADDRPAPWVQYAMLVGLGMFLLHNLVDFSLFEPGPMYLFAFVGGAALGAVSAEAPPETRRGSRAAAWGTLVVGVVVWIVGLGLAVSVGLAERDADAGDEALRTMRAGAASRHFEDALRRVPFNADYAFRAARARLADPRPGDAEAAASLLTHAVRNDPNRPHYWLHRAYAWLAMPAPDVRAVRADYEQALRLDPNNVDTRLEYAETLRRIGDARASAAQFREALRYNDLLASDEVKRLPPQKAEEVKQVIGELEAMGK